MHDKTQWEAMAAPDGGDVLGTTLMTLTILYSLSQYMTKYWSKIISLFSPDFI